MCPAMAPTSLTVQIDQYDHLLNAESPNVVEYTDKVKSYDQTGWMSRWIRNFAFHYNRGMLSRCGSDGDVDHNWIHIKIKIAGYALLLAFNSC